MDERAVTSVLSECGNNIDAAIKRLGELRLAVGNPAAADQQEAPPSTPPPASSQATAAVAAAAAAAAAEAAEAATPGGPATAEQWVEVLVGEMSAARDLTDARTRAAGFLRQFESFVARYVRQQQAGGASASGASPEPGAAGATPGGSAATGSQSLAQRAAKLAEENALLKKAVQIQHRQLQEKSAAEGEVANLKAMLAQYQEQVRSLQMSNYSLSLHLQKATNSDHLGPHRNPDVF
ncbi:hypothetical protein HXX76_012640 [Chlamydomonas incerta]|uniref:Uncharacterized protein n=1 Tax=Chlamydomonas incerta TaxID=51695 RepID=A0A835SV24_CHLIN|nr:hypothetical protein HXX76_012640 [Chlamydomonas incerta]|eukprot:KAG2427130.1 hypothetical protein HXX76_012640 [Chlamydomonas incerta]